MSGQPISPDDISKAIKRSGYLLEHRLTKQLTAAGFHAEANYPYKDPHSGKTRELDLLGAKQFHFSKLRTEFLSAVLIVECVNNPLPVAFFERNLGNSYRPAIRMVGFPNGAEDPEYFGGVPLINFLDIPKLLGQEMSFVASQFCSFKKKGSSGEWQAYHDDVQFDSFRNLSHELDFLCSTMIDRNDLHRSVRQHLFFPILVLQGDILSVRLVNDDEQSLTITQADRVTFRRLDYVQSELSTYDIQVVTESAFPGLLVDLTERMERLTDSVIPHVKNLRDRLWIEPVIEEMNANLNDDSDPKELFENAMKRWSHLRTSPEKSSNIE